MYILRLKRKHYPLVYEYKWGRDKLSSIGGFQSQKEEEGWGRRSRRSWRYLSNGNVRLKAEDIEFSPKRVRVSEAAGREGVSIGNTIPSYS